MIPIRPIEYFLGDRVVRPDLVLRIKWRDGSVSRLCTTFGGLRMPSDMIETTHRSYYSGAPVLLDIPEFRQLINGQADDITLSLSGLWPELARQLDDQAVLAQDAEVDIGRIYWDADWQMIGGARWGWAGRGGQVQIDEVGARMKNGKITPRKFTVNLSVVTQTIRRAGSGTTYWCSPQHMLEFPDDAFFDRANKISTGYVKPFPKL